MDALESLMQQGSLEEAERMVDERLTRNPLDPDARVAEARMKALRGDLSGARETLEMVTKTSPAHAGARTYLAVVLDLLGKSKTADMFLGMALKSDPEFAPAHYVLARQLLRAGNAEKALGELANAYRKEPGNAAYALRYAQLLLTLGQDDPAGQVLNQLVNAHPDLPEAWLAAARLMLKRHNLKGALGALAEGLIRAPTHVGLAVGLVQAAAAAGDLGLCEKAAGVLGQQDARFNAVLPGVLAVLKARTDAAAQEAARGVDKAHAPEVAGFLQGVAEQVSAKRQAPILAAVAVLRQLG